MQVELATAAPASLEAQLLRAVKRCWSAIVPRSLPGHLTPPQLFVLAHLSRAERTQPSDLARDQHVGLSAMTGLVDGLVARGLVERRGDPHDRRVVLLVITEKGRAIWREAQDTVLAAARQLLAPLDGEQRARLAAALGDLEAALDAGGRPPGAPLLRSRSDGASATTDQGERWAPPDPHDA